MAKKTEITLQELTVQNPTLKIALAKFEGVKQQLDERAKQCLLIKVVDEASLSVCEQNLTKMNDLVSAVETLHKETKAPHLKNCQAIDSAKNYILGFDVDPIKYLKDEKIAWIKLGDDYEKFKAWLKFMYDNLTLENIDSFLDSLKKEVSSERWKGYSESVKSEINITRLTNINFFGRRSYFVYTYFHKSNIQKIIPILLQHLQSHRLNLFLLISINLL